MPATHSNLKAKWKTIVVLLIAISASFSLGVFANQVIVQQVSSIAGNHVKVLAPELQILNNFWNIDVNQSLVTSLVLQVTTVGVAGSPVGVKNYQVVVQVSCLGTLGVPVTCSTGSTTIPLPSNLNGAQATIDVILNPAIDPETTEIDDLSYIVTGGPVSSTASGVIAVTPNATPTLTSNGTATLQTTLISYGGFVGNVALSPLSIPDGAILTSANVTLQAGGKTNATLQLNDNLAPTGNNIIGASVVADVCFSCIVQEPVYWIVTHFCAIVTNTFAGFSLGSVTIHTSPTSPTATILQGDSVSSLCGLDDITISDFLQPGSGVAGPSPTITSQDQGVSLPGPFQVDLTLPSLPCVKFAPGFYGCNFHVQIDATTGSVGSYTLFNTATANGVAYIATITINLIP